MIMDGIKSLLLLLAGGIAMTLWSSDFSVNWTLDTSIFPEQNNFGQLIPADPKGNWAQENFPEKIRNLKIPEQFLIDKNVVRKNQELFSISLLNDVLSIHSKHLVSLYSRKAIAGFQHLRIEAEIAGEGVAGIGIYGYGRFSQHFLPASDFASREFQKKTFSFPLEKSPQTSYVRLVLIARGNIQFRKIAIFTAAMPAQWSQAEGKITALYGKNQAALIECSGWGSGAPAAQRFLAKLPEAEAKFPWKTGDVISMALRPIKEKDQAVMELMEQIVPKDVRFLPRKIAIYATNRPSVRKSLMKQTNITPSSAAISIVRDNPPLTGNQIAAMEAARLQELKKVNDLIKNTIGQRNQKNMAFQKDWRKQQKKYQVIQNTGVVWANEKGCFYALPQRYLLLAESRIPAEKLEALAHWNQILAAQNITLIVQVIPHFYDVAARVLNPAWTLMPDLSSAMIVKQLLEQKIQAQYLTDRIVQRAREGDLLFGYPRSRLPMAPVWQIAAEAAAERIEPLAKEWMPDRLPELFLIHSEPSDLVWPAGIPVYPNAAGAPIPCRKIAYGGAPVFSDPSSPVLIVGDPMIAGPVDSGGYGAHFAMKMQMFPHILHSSDFNFIERMYIYGDMYCKGKSVVILPVLISDLVAPGAIPDPGMPEGMIAASFKQTKEN